MHVNNISIFWRQLIHSILLNFSFETISVPSFKVRTFSVMMLPPSTFQGKMLGICQEKWFSHNSGSSSKLTIWWSPSSPLCWHHCPSWWSSSGPHHPSAPSSWSPCLLDNFLTPQVTFSKGEHPSSTSTFTCFGDLDCVFFSKDKFLIPDVVHPDKVDVVHISASLSIFLWKTKSAQLV